MKNLIHIVIFFTLFGLSGCSIFKNKGFNSKNNSINQGEQRILIALLIEATTEKIIGNLDEADSLFKECLKIDPENAVCYFELSGIYRLNENISLSIEYAEKAVAYDNKNEWYKANLALFYNEQSRYKDASKIFEQLTKEIITFR